ncbi:hypothetical protein V2G26_019805 [Clonostachys chloroleuca]
MILEEAVNEIGLGWSSNNSSKTDAWFSRRFLDRYLSDQPNEWTLGHFSARLGPAGNTQMSLSHSACWFLCLCCVTPIRGSRGSSVFSTYSGIEAAFSVAMDMCDTPDLVSALFLVLFGIVYLSRGGL